MPNETIAGNAANRPPTTSGAYARAIVTGLECLSDAELVVLVVGSGRKTTELAMALVEGGLLGLARAGLGELARCSGWGTVRATRLAASVELGRRAMMAASIEPSSRMPSKDAVVAWARPRLAAIDHEELWLLALDGRQGLRAARRVASGGIHGLHVGVRDVLRVALKEAASAFVLMHNHPSGDPTPSQEDITFTRAVAGGAVAVGTPLLDHVIIARQHSSSMLDLGLLTHPPAPQPLNPASAMRRQGAEDREG